MSETGQNGGPNLEFLVVCNNYALFRTLTSSIREVGGRLNCAASIASARDYIARRKIDGLVVDLDLSGGVELIGELRRGNTNKFSVVFGCVSPGQQAELAMAAGANFVLLRPLDTPDATQVFTSARRMMLAEKRRFFRYPLLVPVGMKVNGDEVEATMANLSEGGMAIWSLRDHPSGALIDFSFALPFGGAVQGRGEVAWSNGEGTAGLKFHILHDYAYTHLSGWLGRRGQLARL